MHDVFYGRYGLFVYCVATAIVLWRLTQPRPGTLGAAPSWKPVRWVGAISYEMYLWHWPTYLVVTPDRSGLSGLPLLAVRLSIVVALAWATARLVDDPIRRGVRLRSPHLARVMVVGTVRRSASASACSRRPSARNLPSAETSDRSPIAARPQRTRTQAALNNCSSSATRRPPPSPKASRPTPGIYGLSAQPGLTVWNRAILGCPIVSFPVFVIDGNHVNNKCGGAGYWQKQWASDVVDVPSGRSRRHGRRLGRFRRSHARRLRRARRHPPVRHDLQRATSAHSSTRCRPPAHPSSSSSPRATARANW